MIKVFLNDTKHNILNLDSDTWMCLNRGEGEKEIANHGWSRVVTSFSQETEATGQQRSRSDQNEPKLYTQSRVQDAQDSPSQLPFFLSLSLFCTTKTVRSSVLRGLLGFGQSSLEFFHFSIRKFFSSLRNSPSSPLRTELQTFVYVTKQNRKSWGVVTLLLGVWLGSESAAFAGDVVPVEQGAGKFVPLQEKKAEIKPFAGRYMTAPVQKSPEEKLRQVADMYEKHFLREMTKGMRSTVGEGGFVKTNAGEKIFREQLDEQYVENWGNRGGIGLSEMIYTQLVEKFGAQLGIKQRVQKPSGPLPLDERSNYTALQYARTGKNKSVSVRFNKTQSAQEVAAGGTPSGDEVKSPWDGTVVGIKTLADEQKVLEIAHDNGLRSQVGFQGTLSKVSTGEKLQAGQTLGVLSPGAKALYWSVEPTAEPGPDTVSE